MLLWARIATPGMIVLAIWAILQGLSDPVAAQAPTADPWAELRRFVGEWKGVAEGQPGKGTVSRTYEFVLSDRFLHERNVSTYPPQPKNEKGEVHRHWSVFSYDRARKTLVLRQFHQEGFVNQFVRIDGPAGELLFETEAIENLPAGWKARERYRFPSATEFIETFELAAPGKPFQTYSTTTFTRVR